VVRWDKGDTVRMGDDIFSMENETKVISWIILRWIFRKWDVRAWTGSM